MKIAAWVTIGAYVIGVILMITAISMGEFQWGGFFKVVIFGTIALAWAIGILKKEYRKAKELQQQPPEIQ